MPGRGARSEFSPDEDILLTKFIATHNPPKQGRSGNALYKRLVDNVDGKWKWSGAHTWQSWRNRYAKNSDEFDRKILKYQKKKGINSEEKVEKEKPVSPPPDGQEKVVKVRSNETRQGRKRAGGQVSPQQRKAKRAKLESNQPDGGSSRLSLVEVEPTSQIPAAESSNKVHSPLPAQEQLEIVPDVPLSTQEPSSTVNVPPLPARSDALFITSSQPGSPVRTPPPTTSQLPPSSEPLASSSQQIATPKPLPSRSKLISKPKPVSPLFRSFSPTPTPNHSTSTRKRDLPKVVEGHFTTLLTDRLGRIRLGNRSESEEEEVEAWPPVRRKGKEKDVASGPTAVSPSAVRELPPKREPEAQRLPAILPLHRLEPEHHPFSQVPFLPPLPPPNNRTLADVAESPLNHRSTKRTRQLVQNLRDGRPGSGTGPSTSGLPPAKPVVQPAAGSSKLTTAVPSGFTSTAKLPPEPAVPARAPPTNEENTRLASASTLAQTSTGSKSSTVTTIQQTQVPSKGESAPATDVHPVVPLQERDSRSDAPAPRRSNIRPLPEPNSPFLPSSKDKGKGKRRAEPPLTHAQRLLTRTQRRRQTVGGYEYDDVPSIDLTRAPSAASTSRIPRSRGSISASISHLPHRYSLPVQSTPSAIPADLSGYLTTPGQSGPAILPVPPTLITPADVPLSASIGFSTLISRIAAAHGYAPSVVLEVYKRLRSLKEVEGFVRAMRNATEEWVGAEFERREREARKSGGASTRQNSSESSGSGEDENSDDEPRGSRPGPSLQPAPLEHRTPNGLYVRYVRSPDVSEYEPPPTSRAAQWKRASMGEVGSLSGSWRASAVGRSRTKEDETAEHNMEEVEDAIDGSEEDGDEDGGDDVDDDGTASVMEDEESQDDVERAEEESVAEELVPESLQDEGSVTSNLEQDADDEPAPDSDPDAELLGGHQGHHSQHHEFSQAQARHHATHIKRESLTPPRLNGDPDHVPVLNGAGVTDDDLSSARRTRSVSRSWNAYEDRALLSANWEMLKMLEGQRGKGGMRQRVVQLLR
ncbi:hypothetical protein M405DRAFT_832108 [Rhizopogon salebrosus TDB-379]|nr:hypothetical protein M405DRAFT_832108 [Rhizopogon salebrosus TDB-379]